jgi:hypothetical protein
MPLKGEITSFGVSEIFQLIAHQRKSGTLEIQTHDGLAQVRFLEGRLLEAWPDKRSPAEYIGSLLVRGALITPAQLDHALDVQRQSLRRLGEILLRSGALRVAEFQQVLAIQHRETAYRLLRLKRGTFRFVPGAVEVEEGISVPTEVGELLMEGFRQLDEWPALLEVIPSEKQVFGRVAEPPSPEELTRNESRVLLLVDGTLTVREVVDRARLGEFQGWEALAGLFQRGLVQPLGAARRARTEPKTFRPSRLPDLAAAIALALLTGTVLALFLHQGPPVSSRLEEAVRAARHEARQVAERGAAWQARAPARWPEPPQSSAANLTFPAAAKP